MIQWLKENKAGIALLIVALASVGFVLGCSGGLGSIIKVDVPTGVRQAVGTQARVPYNETQMVLTQWNAFVASNADQFQRNIDDASGWIDFWGMMVNLGLEEGQGVLSTVPGGGLAIAALTYFAGLLTRKPGDGSQMQGLKDALANAAAERERAVSQAKDAAWDEATIAAKKDA